MMTLVKRLAIIGAGPSSLSLMRAFRLAQLNGAKLPEIVCFEKQNDWGGLWNYTWRTGTDEYGDTVHGSMYQNMWTNNPKENVEYSDYSFMEHFGKSIPSFSPRPVLYDYIIGRANKSDIRKFIKFEMRVESVVYACDKFTLDVWNKKDNIVYTEVFDYLVVASGHFSVPYIPEYQGIVTFPGRVLHSHDFRNAEQFKGMDILIIGSGLSAEDIAIQCWKYGSKSVTIIYRHKPIGHNWPDGIKEVHYLEKIEGNIASFRDGAQQTADVIIFCTGYLFYFPFLENKLKYDYTQQRCPGLYKGTVFQNNHKLFYIGMTTRLFPLLIFNLQAWFVRDVIMKYLSLPSQEDINNDISHWLSKRAKLTFPSDRLVYETDYVNDLLPLLSGYPKFDFDLLCQHRLLLSEHKRRNILTFRDQSYKSAVTGTVSPCRVVKWLDAKGESLELFLDSEFV